MKEFTPQSEHETPATTHHTDPAVRELILQAREGSGEAYATLRGKFRPLFEASLARFSSSEMSKQEREDLREEGERIFLGAISSFDTEQDGVDFGLYAKICLRNGLVSEWRRIESRRKTVTLPLPEGADPTEDPAQRLVEEERFRHLCHTVRGHLSAFENRVWWQYVTGVSVPEIARSLGCEEKSVHNAIYRIRRKLRRCLSGEGT